MMKPQDDIRYFCLQGLLSEQTVLAFNPALGSLCLLASSAEETPQPRLLAEQLFTESECCVLLPVLEAHPHFCPYEVLLAHFTAKHVTPAVIMRCRKQLNEAFSKGTWDFEMRPVRNVLSRTRLKLRVFGITVVSLLETGYLLRPVVVGSDASHEEQ
jgi:hypothetical protein